MTDANAKPPRTFTCQTCGKDFSLSEATLAKFPNWTPKQCLGCREGAKSEKPKAKSADMENRRAAGRSHSSREENLTTAQVLEKYTAGPKDGVFTDGSSEPNPGPGGWGAVYVVGDKVIAQRHGRDPQTTNNRMELAALSAGIDLVPVGTPATIYSDSQLCVNTMNVWAKNWEAKDWKKKGGPIMNLELVQEVYYKLGRRPELKLEWIAAHVGYRWNEYADSLTTAYKRIAEGEDI